MPGLTGGTYPHRVVPRRPRDVIGALVVGAPVALLSAWMAFVSMPAGAALIVTVAIVVATAALTVRLRFVFASFAVVLTACAVQAWVSGLFLTLPSNLVFLVSVYSVMAWGNKRSRVAAGGLALAGAGLATWRLVTDASVTAAGIRPEWPMVWALLSAVVIAAGAVGLWRGTQLAYMEALRERARRAEADREEETRAAVRGERQRIARDMHDIVAHSLSVMVSQAQGGRYAAAGDPGQAVQVLSTIETQGRQALTDMRGLVKVLRLESGEISSGEPQPGLGMVARLLELTRSTGRQVEFEETGSARPLSASAELAVYRLIQESLTNVVRHAGPRASTRVTLGWEAAAVAVEVANDEAPATESIPRGYGLIGMSERLTAVGGTMSAGHTDDDGFTVQARIPYPAALSGEVKP